MFHQQRNLMELLETVSRVSTPEDEVAVPVVTVEDDITTDHGWKIVISRGLDVFQRCEMKDAFSFANRMQQHRQRKDFNVTFVRQGD